MSAPRRGSGSRPLVLVLCGRTGIDSMRWMTRGAFEARARKAGWVVAYPEPVEKVWNDGRGVATIPAQRENIDDTGFLLAAAEHLAKRHGGRADAFYVAGFSTGGMMALRLACEHPDRVAAAAAVAATLPEPLEARCRPRRPVPVLLMTGDADPFMHFPEGELVLGGFSQGRIVAPARTAALWARLDGCGGKPRASALPPLDPSDGTQPRLTRWAGCQGGSEVSFYEVDGGGHAWPGGGEYEIPEFVGPTSRNLDATAAIWDLFTRHVPPAR